MTEGTRGCDDHDACEQGPCRVTKPTKRWYEDYPAVKKAMQEVFDLAAGRKRWLMRVPVDRDTDSDCILVDGIKAAFDAGQAAGVASVPYNRLCDCGSGSHVRHCAMCMERYRAAGVAQERERCADWVQSLEPEFACDHPTHGEGDWSPECIAAALRRGQP